MSPSADAVKCPTCGEKASGNFCHHCGAALGGRFCTGCGNELAADARFCNECGAKGSAPPTAPAGPVRAAHREAARAVVGGSNLPWWIAGVAMFVVIAIVGLSAVRPGVSEGPTAGSAPAAGAAAVDLNSMTPRQAADRLFNRVMRSASAGDSTEAQAFLPMAIAAYERARPLDLDGLFHMAMLQWTAMELEASLATARELLAADPDHVLGLATAAEALRDLGRPEEAAQTYRHLLEVFDEATQRPLPEYDAHRGLLDTKRSEAEAYLSRR